MGSFTNRNRLCNTAGASLCNTQYIAIKTVNQMRIVIGLAVLVILSASIYSYFRKPTTATIAENNSNNSLDSVDGAEAEKYLTLDEETIAEHKTADNCWLYIDELVYDASSFIQIHSGGPDKILPYCGGDATDAFKSRVHSEGAKLLLKRLNLGTIDERILKSKAEKIQNDNLLEPSE